MCLCVVCIEIEVLNCPTANGPLLRPAHGIMIGKPGYCHEYFHILMESTNKGKKIGILRRKGEGLSLRTTLFHPCLRQLKTRESAVFC